MTDTRVPQTATTNASPHVSVVASAGLPVAPTASRPAIMPLHPRFARQVDVCAVFHNGSVEFVARDVLQAIGYDLGAYVSERSHDAPTSFVDHATATTWSRQMIGDIFRPFEDRAEIASFLRWLDERIETLEVLGLDTIERKTLYGNGHRDEPATADAPAAASMPEFYSVSATARILSRDPSIQIGRDALFEHLHKTAWIERRGDSWKPNRDLVLVGYLLTQHVAVPARPDAYPQILVTPSGIEVLHQRLGGTAALNLHPSDHLTLIEATP